MKSLRIPFLFLLPILAACSTPYVPPAPGQPVAEISAYSEGRVEKIVYNEKDCYSGQAIVPQTSVKQKRASAPLKIPAEKQAIVILDKPTTGSFRCRSIGGFIPENGRHYIAFGGRLEAAEKGSWAEKLPLADYASCSLSVFEELPDGGLKAVDLEPLQIKQKGFACIRFEK